MRSRLPLFGLLALALVALAALILPAVPGWLGGALTYVWFIQIVDDEGGSGIGTSLALDSQGRPHIAYKQGMSVDLRYARFDGTRWHTETVDAWGGTGAFPSIALDGQGRPHTS